MNKIESFKTNHNTLKRGVYISRVDGDVVTYDIRTRIPNGGDYMSNAVMHTVEHIFATYVRNSDRSGEVLYFGPMGCRTGFYLLLRDSVSAADALSLIRDAFDYINGFSGRIPGSDKIECGNYLEHDLEGARREAASMLTVLAHISDNDMTYPD